MSYFAQFRASAAPLPADAPDLDSEPALQTFFAVTEGSLPVSFRDFDRKSFDDRAIITELTGFLGKSRDLRLLTLAAKVFSLSENFSGFFETIDLIAELIDTHWNELPPRPNDGGAELRSVYLQSLEDMPTVLLPLQQAPLVKDRQLGPLSLRSVLVARRQLPARRDEDIPSEAAVIGALRRHDPASDLTDLYAGCTAALQSLARMRSAFIANDGYDRAPNLEKLTELLTRIASVLAEAGGAPVAVDPDAQPAAQDDAAPSPAGISPVRSSSRILSAADAAGALAAVCAYYQTNEPSNLAFLLVRQAEKLIGKTFVEAMQVLAPSQSDDIRIDMGRSSGIVLTFRLLESLVPPPPDEEAPVEAAPVFDALNRGAAVELMNEVERYFHAVEPSSPIPLLLERARQFAARDFSSVVEELTKRPD